VIDFTCPGCCADLHVADELAGRVIKCRECAQPCRVPVPPPPKPARQREEAPKPEAEPVPFRCPFCGCDKEPVPVLRRVPLTLLLELVMIGGVLEIADLILRHVLYYHVEGQSNAGVAVAALVAAVGVIVALLLGLRSFTHLKCRSCPRCKVHLD
jgi:hypothetical protein